MSCINKAIAKAQIQCEDGYFYADEWDIVISEDLYSELKKERNETYFTSEEEIQRYNGVDIKVVPNWMLGSTEFFLIKKGFFKKDEIPF